ncbi:MAG: hypothetical protein AB7K09_03660 [Planctomycetota bacterium]
MKKFIVIIAILGITGFATAQDLDSPVQGVSAGQSEGQAGASAYDILIAKIIESEARYMNRETHEGSWGVWGVGGTFFNGNIDWWFNILGNEGREHEAEARALWAELSPAEFAAADAVWHQSWQRLTAAGLN